MSNPAMENGLAALGFARQVTLGLLEDIPEDKLFHQITPGGNHAVWVVGHLTVTDDDTLAKLAGREAKCPEAWRSLFGMGSKPTGNPGDCPSISDLRQHLDLRREELVEWFKSLDEAKLASSLPEELGTIAKTYGASMSTLAVHEGLHAGQLTMIRKSLGSGPKFW